MLFNVSLSIHSIYGFYWMTFFFPWWHILSVLWMLQSTNTFWKETHTFRMVSRCHYSFADKVSIVLGHWYEVGCSLAALATMMMMLWFGTLLATRNVAISDSFLLIKRVYPSNWHSNIDLENPYLHPLVFHIYGHILNRQYGTSQENPWFSTSFVYPRAYILNWLTFGNHVVRHVWSNPSPFLCDS